jgi:hypothetical protein
MMLVFIFGRHPSILKYYTMFLIVSKKTIGILLCFLPLILAFSCAFNILFYNLTTEEENPFHMIKNSMRKTFIMMTGEFDVKENNFKNNTIINGIILIVFIILIAIILMNLINAIAISDTYLVINKAERFCLISNVKAYTEIETLFDCYNYNCTKYNIFSNIIQIIRDKQLEDTPCFST